MSLLGSDPRRWDRPIRTGRRDKPIIHLPSVALRVAIVIGLAAVLFGVILFRLWFLQILSGQEFVARANNQRLRPVKIMALRGQIVDRHGEVIVDNRAGLAVGIRLMDVPDGQLDALVVRLARVLKMRPAKIRARIMDHLAPSWPSGDGAPAFTWKNVVAGDGVPLDLVLVKEDVDRGTMSYLKEHTQSFPGVETASEYLRAYPNGEMAAQLLGHLGEVSAEQLEERHFKGYSGGDIVGQDGLEWTYDKWLRGRDGVARIEVDAYGQPKKTKPVSGRMAEPGDTLVTTLDAKVQSAAEEALRTGISLAHAGHQYEANGGAAVVLDVRNGDILGMASYPTYDPSVWVGGISTKDYKKLSDKHANNPMLVRPIMETKAVGSTFKVVTSVAALEEGIISSDTGYFCPGYYTSTYDNADPPQKFKCWALDGHGTLGLVGAITQSCDVYFYNIGDRFYGRQGTALEDWAERFGMGRVTGVDIPGEQPGRVPTPSWKQKWFKTEIDKLWKPSDSIYLAVGQGNLEASPLQLAVTYAAIANGGKIVTPHLGLRLVSPAGQTVRTLQPTDSARRTDISQSTLDVVRHGLYEAAHSPSGTSAPVFAAYKVPVAGKTGTAEVYDNGRIVNYAWYASYAPADNPKYAVVVMIEKGGHGASTAAPAARIIYDALFHIDSGEFTGTVQGD